ncbi:MAG: hypothetical protein JW748_01160 [Anaerolineales bacterium]|nr:hypothetical protein [Anaerolineales bacterium]
MKLTNIAVVLGGFTCLLLGLSGGLGLLLALPLSDLFFSAIGADLWGQWSVGFAIASTFVLVPIFFLEIGIYWVRNGWRMGGTQGSYPTGNIWSWIGRILLAIVLTVSSLLILGVLAILAFEFTVLGVVLSQDPASLIRPFTIMAFILAMYACIRIILWIFWRAAGKSASRGYSLGLAKYHLVDGGVEIDLNYFMQIGKRGPSRFTIRFDEIQEVRGLTYAETLTYMNYIVGPNLELVAREVREVYQWRTGKIARPTAHYSTAKNPFGQKVLLRGPEVFYLISFHTDPADLLEAFRRAQQPYSANSADASPEGI